MMLVCGHLIFYLLKGVLKQMPFNVFHDLRTIVTYSDYISQVRIPQLYPHDVPIFSMFHRKKPEAEGAWTKQRVDLWSLEEPCWEPWKSHGKSRSDNDTVRTRARNGVPSGNLT